MRLPLMLSLIVPACHAAVVNVYFAGGQSNATPTWANAIENTLEGVTPQDDVAVAYAAHTGSQLWQWTWGGVRRDFYLSDLAVIQSVMQSVAANGDTPVFAGIFWFQGEGDATAPSTIPLYDDRFNDMLSFFRQDLGLTATPSYMLEVIDANQATIYDDPAQLGTTRQAVDDMRAQLFALGSTANSGYADTRGYARVDQWHLTFSAQAAAGTALANVLLNRTTVPEPSSAMLCSLAGVFILRRKRPSRTRSALES